MPFLEDVRHHIERIGPYGSLLVLALPIAIIEPLKLVSVFVFGGGHWITGTAVLVCAYALSLFVVERLFNIVKPKLLELPWFAAIWSRFVAVRRWAWIRLRTSLMPVAGS